MLAARTTRISSSPTMKGLIAAERLRAAGVNVVDLSAGEPDFPTPEHVKDAAHAAIAANYTKYTPNSGVDEIQAGDCRDATAPTTASSTTRARSSSAPAASRRCSMPRWSLFDPGDEVITHTPGWPTLVEQIKLADATPVIVQTSPEDGFTLRAQPFLDAITPRTKAIMINSPANPTGALMTEAEMVRLADAAAPRGIWIILDLCYEKLIYDPVAHNLPLVLGERMRDRTILTGSASKAYAMTGWRCGWLLATRRWWPRAMRSRATARATSARSRRRRSSPRSPGRSSA